MNELKDLTIPKHIAFIMDGNGRWAEEKGKNRTSGHKEGSNTLKQICKDTYDLGVEYVTVYAFSTENWKRPKEEVNYLMTLLRQFLKDSIKETKKNNMKVRIIGDRESLSQDLQKSIEKLENASKNNTGLKLQVALNYGGQDEIVRGIKRVTDAISKGNLEINDLNPTLFANYLDTAGIPDPDLMIRTSGIVRISNFLLWQLAYSEMYFTNKYWPDLRKEDVIEAIFSFNKVERKFGGVK